MTRSVVVQKLIRTIYKVNNKRPRDGNLILQEFIDSLFKVFDANASFRMLFSVPHNYFKLNAIFCYKTRRMKLSLHMQLLFLSNQISMSFLF